MKSRITIFVSILLIASMLLSLSVNAQSIDAEFNKDSFFKQAQIINSSLDGITFELTETINKNILSTNKTHTILKIVPLNNESAYDLYNIATQIQNNSELTSNRGDLGKEKWDIAGTIQIYSIRLICRKRNTDYRKLFKYGRMGQKQFRNNKL